MPSPIAIFGTASDVGKSTITAALLRILKRAGYRVAPFKAQNMSNNSFVTLDGREIGRAQAFQAFAAKILPSSDMNPILLKPSGNSISQVIVQGRPYGNFSFKEYFTKRDFLADRAFESLRRLQKDNDIVIIEGAGSCAEVNLRGKDFTNFEVAERVDANVILVADIERGGVFAQIIGTLECLNESERARIKGIIINKFRGDISLFEEGVDFIERKTGKPVLGVVPLLNGLHIDFEDSLNVEKLVDKGIIDNGKINLAVLKLPYVSNFTDFDAFLLEESVNLNFLYKPSDLSPYDAIFIPGSKSVAKDLEWITKSGWKSRIENYKNSGGVIVGICGGFQMLGRKVIDPLHLESDITETEGLGFLDIGTTISGEKTVSNVEGYWMEDKTPVKGYEIHMGRTKVNSGFRPIKLTKRNQKPTDEFDGAASKKSHMWGTYIHGLFDNYTFRHAFLRKVARDKFKIPTFVNLEEHRDKKIEQLAEHFEAHLNMERFKELFLSNG